MNAIVATTLLIVAATCLASPKQRVTFLGWVAAMILLGWLAMMVTMALPEEPEPQGADEQDAR